MAFLQLAQDIDLTQAVISVWFKVPSATKSAVMAPLGGSVNSGFTLANFVPLLFMGPQRNLSYANYFVGCDPHPLNTDPCYGESFPCSVASPGRLVIYLDGTYTIVPGGGPSFIGCYYSADVPNGAMSVCLQTDMLPNMTDNACHATSYSAAPGPTCAGNNVDQTALLNSVKDAYGSSYNVLNGNGSYGGSPAMVPSPDKWHHFLISWDLSNGCGSRGLTQFVTTEQQVLSVAKMWCAFDDVDKNSADLPVVWANTAETVDFQTWGPNDIISNIVSQYAGSHNGCNLDSLVSLNAGGPPSNPIVIPCGSSIVLGGDSNAYNIIQNVELAEYQLFSGVTLDTSITGNRRFFVTSDGKPADASLANAGLGKTPEIYLGGSSKKWIAGTNQGSAGNFTKTGTVKSYTPGPSLG